MRIIGNKVPSGNGGPRRGRGIGNIPVAKVDGMIGPSPASPMNKPVDPVSVAMLANTASAKVGDTVQLAATVLPANASNKAVTWSSSNTAIATVSASGLVTVVGVGKPVITVTDALGHTDTCAFETYTLYTFENDSIGSAPADMTALSGTLGVVETGASAWAGRYLHETSVAAGASAAGFAIKSRLDKTVAEASQVLKWRQFTDPANMPGNIANYKFILRAQAGTTSRAYGTDFTDVPYGYMFESCNYTVKITKLNNAAGGAFTVLGTFTVNLNNCYFRASAIGNALNLEYSADDKIWTTAIAVTDSTYATSTAKISMLIDGYRPFNTYIDNITYTNYIPTNILPESISLNKSFLTAVVGSAPQQLVATVLPANASSKAATWASSNTAIATVSSVGYVQFISAGTVTITATDAVGHSAQCSVTAQAAGADNMDIGVNFWNVGWEGWNDFISSGSVPAWNGSTITNWRSNLLTDLAATNGPIRFMDWGVTNNSPIMNWSDRLPATATATAKSYDVAASIRSYYGGATTYAVHMVPYEWMVDLCNQTNRDMWLCVPTFATDDYVTQLATLVNSRLNSNRKVYIEYSNETWNGGFLQSQYVIDRGVALSLPGMNQWYQGVAFSVYRSLQVFKLFSDVFGAANVGWGKRLVRVIAGSGDITMSSKAIESVVFSGAGDFTHNPTWNTVGQQPDCFAGAPYVNTDPQTGTLDGNAANVHEAWVRAVDAKIDGAMAVVKALCTTFSIPMILYEGGTEMSVGAGTWSRDPLTYNDITYMANRLNALGVKIWCYYTLYGLFPTGTNTGWAWGLKSVSSDANTQAVSPKFAAIKDFVTNNP